MSVFVGRMAVIKKVKNGFNYEKSKMKETAGYR